MTQKETAMAIATATVLFNGQVIAIYKNVLMDNNGFNTLIYDCNMPSKVIASISSDYTVLTGKIEKYVDRV